MLRAADAYRRPQPVSAALPGDGPHRYRTRLAGAGGGVLRVWPSASAAFRQRSAICLARSRRVVATVRQGDQGRGTAGADRARQAAAEWPARANASDLVAG